MNWNIDAHGYVYAPNRGLIGRSTVGGTDTLRRMADEANAGLVLADALRAGMNPQEALAAYDQSVPVESRPGPYVRAH